MKNIILMLILFFSTAVHAQLITKIEIFGNSKTQEKAILKAAQVELNQEIGPKQLAKIKRRLANCTQFIFKNITLSDAGVLSITIKEKWTIIPLPILNQSGDYYNRGFVIYENNFLGRMEKLIPAISWNNSGMNVVLIYTSETLFTENWGINVLMANVTDRVRVERNSNTLSLFNSQMKAIDLAPTYTKGNHNFRLGPIVFQKIVNKYNLDYSGAGVHGRYQYSQHTNLKFHKDGYHTIFNIHAVPNYKNQLFTRIEHEIHYTKRFKQHFFDTYNRLGWMNKRDFLFPYILGGEEGHRGYNSLSLPVSQFITQSFQFQYNFIPVINKLYFVPYYEIGYFDSLLLKKYLLDHTFGAGFRYYLRKLSIPALNIEYGYNMNDYSHHFHLSLGIKL